MGIKEKIVSTIIKKRPCKNSDRSKQIKLPKEYWEKGKSKFLAVRLYEEGKTHISQLKPKRA